MQDSVIEVVMMARQAELPGGLIVRRALPRARRRMVGPFVFLDQMGPATFEMGRELTVLPHPHIGLSTITFLFEGEGLHRDSLGTVQQILPGEVNWMTAGRGIVHSERLRPGPSGRVFGVQMWVALPQEVERCEPSFEHYGADAVPVFQQDGASVRLIAGSLFGASSRVRTESKLFYAEAKMEAGGLLRLPAQYEERAAFVVEGAIAVGETPVQSGEIAVFRPTMEISLRAAERARLLLLGGDTLDGPRHISWNFVSSSKELLKQAAHDWREQRFPRIPGETAYIPLPEDGDAPVNYP